MQLEQPAQVYSRLQKRLSQKTVRRRVIRYSLLGINLLLVVGVVGFIVRNPQSSAAVSRSVLSSASQAGGSAAADPLDQLSSADIALSVARLTNIPEATAVNNQASSENAQLAIVQTSDSLVAKPQVVATAFKSNKDIQTYMAKDGDSVASIAAQFNITSDSVRWSNSIQGGAVVAGQTLYIPPVNGIVYVVKSGDTPESLAQTYHTTKDKIIAYNDAEISGISVGERILIPDGQQPTAAVSVRSSYTYASGFPWGTGPIYGYNGYDYGFCTWYVASRISVPTNWGNANTWDNLAPLSGWTVSTTPRPGAIAQTDAGAEGHVAIVEAVSADGTQIKFSDMNGLAGWGRVGYSDWAPASHFQHYIYH